MPDDTEKGLRLLAKSFKDVGLLVAFYSTAIVEE
jgi:hypothetical protein